MINRGKSIRDIKLIYIEKATEKHILVERFIHSFPSAQIKYIDNYTRLAKNSTLNKKRFDLAKKSLVLAENKGKFIKEFYLHPSLRGSPVYSINHSIGCLYDCQYCYLQAYQNYPAFVQFVNLERISDEIESIMQQSTEKPLLFSSGILSDSLLFDEFTGLCSYLFPLFASLKGAKLEIRSRTANISHLLDSDLARKNIILTWSLSPEKIIRKYEPRTPSAYERIKAAAACQRAGYNIGFHLDPLIHYNDWREGYKALITYMKSHLEPESMQYIFLGSFRFNQYWAKVYRMRFPKSPLLLEELVLSADAKFRYFKPIRLEMYCQIAGWLGNWNSDIPLYLAMEPPEVWQKWEDYRKKKGGGELSSKA